MVREIHLFLNNPPLASANFMFLDLIKRYRAHGAHKTRYFFFGGIRWDVNGKNGKCCAAATWWKRKKGRRCYQCIWQFFPVLFLFFFYFFLFPRSPFWRTDNTKILFLILHIYFRCGQEKLLELAMEAIYTARAHCVFPGTLHGHDERDKRFIRLSRSSCPCKVPGNTRWARAVLDNHLFLDIPCLDLISQWDTVSLKKAQIRSR